MINNILIDLGNTLINNKEFNLTKGLHLLYHNLENPLLGEDEFVKIASNLFEQMMKKRLITNQETSFTKYLSDLAKLTEVTYQKSYEALEEEIYNFCVVDQINQDAKVFLLFCQLHHLNVYCFSNSIFSKKVLMTTLQRFHLDQLITSLYSSSDIGFRKPHKYFFEKTPVAKIINKTDTIMVGNDLMVDGEFANNLQIKFAWYNPNHLSSDKSFITLNFATYQTLEEYLLND